MAINPRDQKLPYEQLDRRKAAFSAMASIAASLVGAIGLMIYLLGHQGQAFAATGVQICWISIFGIASVGGVYLLRGLDMAQRLLLVFWLILTALSALLGLQALLWSVPDWWNMFLDVPLAAVVAPMLCVSAAVSVLLVIASAASSRLRYGTMVSVSVAVAVVAVLVVNMIAQRDPYHRSLERMGEFSVSDRTKSVIESLKAPLRITCVYTSSDERARGSDYRPQTMEFLGEMQQEGRRMGKSIELATVTGDSQKADLLARLQQQSANRAPQHVRLLNEFNSRLDAMVGMVGQDQQRWSKLPEQSYLGWWGMNVEVSKSLAKFKGALEDIRADINSANSQAAPADYPALVNRVKASLEAARQELQDEAAMMEKIAKLPVQIAQRREAALKAVAAAVGPAKEMVQIMGDEKAPPPDDPGAVLRKFVDKCADCSLRLATAFRLLAEVGGEGSQDVMGACEMWQTEAVVSQDGTPARVTMTLVEYFQLFAERTSSLGAFARGVLNNNTPESMKKYIATLRQNAADLPAALEGLQQRVQDAMDKLSKPDADSDALLQLATKHECFKDLLQPIDDFAASAAKLPPVRASGVTAEQTAGNIVVLELGDSTEIVSFDSAWPLRGRPDQDPKAKESRAFNGDSAIGSKLMCMMESKPFATVLLTYYVAANPQEPPMPVMDDAQASEPWGTLAQRLRDANFDVKFWNITEPMPGAKPRPATASAPAETESRIIVVLPAPPSVKEPRQGNQFATMWMPQAIDKLRQEINLGTPAMFLTNVSMTPESRFLMEYLQSDWGIEVKSEIIIASFEPAPGVPNQFMLDINRLHWVALNTFTDHPIGKPLRAQRMLWQGLCPIVKVQSGSPARGSVDYQPILSVPDGTKGVWGVGQGTMDQLNDLLFRKKGSYFAPDFDHGDMKPPLDVAVAASSPLGKGHQPSRIVVMTTGLSFADGYLARRVELANHEFGDPPRSDTDLAVNAAYWLIGRESHIAAGPAQMQPIEMISPATETTLNILYIAALPGLVLALGGVILFMRRR